MKRSNVTFTFREQEEANERRIELNVVSYTLTHISINTPLLFSTYFRDLFKIQSIAKN